MTNIIKAAAALFFLPFCQNAFAQDTPARASYECRTVSSSIKIDGVADDKAWANAAWTNYFIDIEGDKKPAPYHKTRMKMLWDAKGLYIFAELEEPHLQGTITKHDAVIFQDNDFEVFIDPDNDELNYYEIEVNTLNTIWDLMLSKPYRKGGRPNNSWTATGLKTAVKLKGTLNNPSDTDKGWSVEMLIPWKAFKENRIPAINELWKMNFSRVQWDFEVKDGKYVKKSDPQTGKTLPENNWVWSNMGVINMHIPEKWGEVTFVK